MEILFVPNQLKLEPLNECMYCGAKEGEIIETVVKKENIKVTAKLSDEHLIPFGLGGTLLLEKSSCQECARITAKIEQDVLKGFLYYPRIIGNLPTRRKKERPTEITLECIGEDEDVFQKDFTVSEAISILIMPVLEQAGCIQGVNFKPKELKVTSIDHKLLGRNVDFFIKSNNLSGLRFPIRLNVHAFVRMLAKIAYGYHVAMNGMFPREESPLLPIIFGKNIEIGYSAQDYVGSSNESKVEVKNDALHLIYTDIHDDKEGNIADSVSIQFFVNKSQKDNLGKYQVFTRIRAKHDIK